MNKPYHLIDFLKLVIRWRKPVLIVCSLSLIGAVIISDPHIMKPYYKSHALCLPLNPNNTSTQSMYGESEQLFFGTSDDIDRTISIITSTPVKIHLVQKFKLFEHYNIDSAGSSAPMTKVLKELDDNFNALLNSKGAIEVTVFDHDKKVAADMANEIVRYADELGTAAMNKSKSQILVLFENKVKAKSEQVQMLADSLVSMKQRYNFSSSIIGLPAMANSGTNKDYQRALETMKQLEEEKRSAIKELNASVGFYEQYKSSINTIVPSISVLEVASPAEKKAKPIRWMIAVSALLISFLLTVLAAAAIESFGRIRKAIKEDASTR